MIKNLYRKRLRRLFGDESGFSLMEVVVAIAIMGIVATAAASLSFNGIATSRAEERQQVATTIANGALETASGWQYTTDASTGVSALFDGRGQTAVQNAFTANSARPGVADTVPGWDPKLVSGTALLSNGTLPIVTPDPNNASAPLLEEKGTDYTVTTLIGTCYEQSLAGVVPTPSGSTPAVDCTATMGSAPISLIRIIVIVSWTAGSKCAANCYYQASTILDPDVDLEWIAPS